LCGFQHESTVYVYLSALRKTAQAACGVGKAPELTIGQRSLSRASIESLISPASFNGITFGNGFVKDKDIIYAFGGKQNGLVSDLFVARFELSTPEMNWSFWDGKQWREKSSDALPVGRGASTSLTSVRSARSMC